MKQHFEVAYIAYGKTFVFICNISPPKHKALYLDMYVGILDGRTFL